MNQLAGPTADGMGLLRSIESTIERVVEGTFGRVFRASVQPVELARKLTKELEDGKVVSLSETYVPNLYTVYLNPKDRARFAEYEASLRTELSVYLSEHARREGYALATKPRVLFESEPALGVGTFGIATQLVTTEAAAPAEAPAAAAPEPAVPVAPTPEPEPVAEEPVAEEPVAEEPVAEQPVVEEPIAAEPEPVVPEEAPLSSEGLPTRAGAVLPPLDPPPLATPPVELPPIDLPPGVRFPDVSIPPAPDLPASLPVEPMAPPPPLDEPRPARKAVPAVSEEKLALVMAGRRIPLDNPVTVLGRSSNCDVVVDDPNASRRHAELRLRGQTAVLVDLDSTNGTTVNSRRIREQPLADGDRVTIGTTTLVFERH